MSADVSEEHTAFIFIFGAEECAKQETNVKKVAKKVCMKIHT
jgi:hypothetical protein